MNITSLFSLTDKKKDSRSGGRVPGKGGRGTPRPPVVEEDYYDYSDYPEDYYYYEDEEPLPSGPTQ